VYNRKDPVSSYIHRVEYFAQTYSDDEVLVELPVVMTEDACTWFDSMLPEIKIHMNDSLDKWICQLQNRFQYNLSAALIEANNLSHSFEDKSKYNVHNYLTTKQSLYLEAGETNKELIIHHIHD
jgi:hypothetical protein